MSRVVAVNVGTPREIEWLGRVEHTSIWKAPVEGRIPVRGVNLAGDDQADAGEEAADIHAPPLAVEDALKTGT